MTMALTPAAASGERTKSSCSGDSPRLLSTTPTETWSVSPAPSMPATWSATMHASCSNATKCTSLAGSTNTTR